MVTIKRYTTLAALALCAAVVLAGCGVPIAAPAMPSTGATPAITPTLAMPGPAPAPTSQPTPTTASSGVGKSPAIGAEAADFTLRNLAGDDVSLSAFRGKVVLLNFFATWCPPCNAELPHLMALYTEYKDQGFEVLALDQAEAPDTVRRFVDANEIPFTVLLDSSATASRLYNARAIPRSLFINAEGVIEIDHVGYMSEEVLRSYIEQMLE